MLASCNVNKIKKKYLFLFFTEENNVIKILERRLFKPRRAFYEAKQITFLSEF